MNWAWAASLDQIWRSPAFPMWMTLAAAGFFGLILLITLLRADRSVANGALTVITLLSMAIAGAATVRVYGPDAPTETRAQGQGAVVASPPALSCIDDLAGDTVAIGCEKALFGSPDAVAASVSYTAARIDRLSPEDKRLLQIAAVIAARGIGENDGNHGRDVRIREAKTHLL